MATAAVSTPPMAPATGKLFNVDSTITAKNTVNADPTNPVEFDALLLNQAYLGDNTNDIRTLTFAKEMLSDLRKTVLEQFGHNPAFVTVLLGQKPSDVKVDCSDITTLDQAQSEVISIRANVTKCMAPFSELEVLIVGAMNLRNLDTGSKSDPYCMFRVGEMGSKWEDKEACDESETRTPVRCNTLYPKWNFKGTIPNITKYKMPELHIRIWDQDSFGRDDEMGNLTVRLVGMAQGEKQCLLDGTNPMDPEHLRLAWAKRTPAALVPSQEYTVKVTTSNVTDAGTDATVYMRIDGTECRTDAFKLDNFGWNDNERAEECTYVSPTLANVGTPLQVHIWHDGSGSNSSWYVKNIKLYINGQPYTFAAYAWIRAPFRALSLLASDATLPQNDSGVRGVYRAAALDRSRLLYRFTTNNPALGELRGLVPPLLDYMHEGDELRQGVVDYEYHDADELEDIGRAGVDVIVNGGLSVLLNRGDRFDTVDEWENLLDTPNLIKNKDDVRVPVKELKDWRTDEEFAWQRLAGMHPNMIEICKGLPADCVITEEDVAGVIPLGTTLAGEIKAGHVFMCDYESLKGVPGTELMGEMRYVCAPISLFYADMTKGIRLKPIAIQLERPSPLQAKPLVFTPKDDDYDWLAAKMTTQSSDFHVHQFRTHALNCHLVQEPILIAMCRQLSTAHPVWKLLRPHFHGLVEINDRARGSLITRDDATLKTYAGWILGMGAPGSMKYAASQWQVYTMQQHWFQDALEMRGLWDNEAIGPYPYRDDGKLLLEAIQKYVSGIIDIYYQNDSTVLADPELQNWMTEMLGEGEVRGLEPLLNSDSKMDSKVQLKNLLTNLIFTASAQHAAVNFSQVDYGGHVINMPAGCYAPPLREKGKIGEKYLTQMLPSKRWTAIQVGVLSFLSQPSHDLLGHFYEQFFESDEAKGVIATFKSTLERISDTIEARNLDTSHQTGRKKPYTYLLPENVPNSTAI